MAIEYALTLIHVTMLLHIQGSTLPKNPSFPEKVHKNPCQTRIKPTPAIKMAINHAPITGTHSPVRVKPGSQLSCTQRTHHRYKNISMEAKITLYLDVNNPLLSLYVRKNPT